MGNHQCTDMSPVLILLTNVQETAKLDKPRLTLKANLVIEASLTWHRNG